jgi:hypothetical protein
MAVIKLASNRKTVHFIDDQGNLFFTHVKGVGLMVPNSCPKCHHEFGGSWPKPIVLLRMPNPVPPDKFKVSDVWQPSVGRAITSDNAYDPKFVKDRAAAAAYVDRVVD